jgi:hypothetical protein
MSALGRLWRRAPAWRLCVITAIATTALAAMFPPGLPHWRFGHSQPAAPMPGGLSASAPAQDAHFAPVPDEAPPESGSLQVLRSSPDRSGVIAFAGRQIPLPAGAWKDLIVARIGGVIPGQQEILIRQDNGQLTGLIRAEAPSPTSGAAGPLANPAFCSEPNAILRDTTAEKSGDSPMAHECWILAESSLTDPTKRAALDGVMSRALTELDTLGIKTPEHMLAVIYFRSDQTGWLSAVLLLPDRHDISAAASRRIQAWVRRFAAAFHQGFDGKLAPGDLPASIARDPA